MTELESKILIESIQSDSSSIIPFIQGQWTSFEQNNYSLNIIKHIISLDNNIKELSFIASNQDKILQFILIKETIRDIEGNMRWFLSPWLEISDTEPIKAIFSNIVNKSNILITYYGSIEIKTDPFYKIPIIKASSGTNYTYILIAGLLVVLYFMYGKYKKISKYIK